MVLWGGYKPPPLTVQKLVVERAASGLAVPTGPPPKSAQEASNMASGQPKDTPKTAPRGPQDAQDCLQDGPEAPQEDPKTPKIASKTTLKRPKMAPILPQDGLAAAPGNPTASQSSACEPRARIIRTSSATLNVRVAASPRRGGGPNAGVQG